MEGKIRVTISDAKRIPTIGKGPIYKPIYITKDVYDMLVLLGFRVNIVEDVNLSKRDIDKITDNTEAPVEKTSNVDEETILTEEPTIDEDSEEDVPTEEEVLTEETNVTEEPTIDEDSEEDVPTEEETEEVDVESLTKKEIIQELEARGIKYSNKDSASTLRKLLIENLD